MGAAHYFTMHPTSMTGLIAFTEIGRRKQVINE